MKRFATRALLSTILTTASYYAGAADAASTVRADTKEVARGKYIVEIAGCTDCHTPGYFTGQLDPAKFLSGSDVGFQVPGVGSVVGRNLTPDKETGIGNWTLEQIVTAITRGTRPDGRVLSPVMPWMHYAQLPLADAKAIAMFLKSLPPVRHAVPGPFAADEEPTVATWRITPPAAQAIETSKSQPATR